MEAKERLFSGLNYVRVCAILSPAFEQSFGLLDAEVATALALRTLGSGWRQEASRRNG